MTALVIGTCILFHNLPWYVSFQFQDDVQLSYPAVRRVQLIDNIEEVTEIKGHLIDKKLVLKSSRPVKCPKSFKEVFK